MRVRTRYGAVVIGAAALALGLSACGGGDPEASGEITVNGSEPENPLIPSNTNETGGGNVIDNLFTGLIEYNPETAAPELAAATSIEANDDLTVWTVKLQDDWTFQDGSKMTASSFVDAWNWAAYGPNAQLNSYFFGSDGLGIAGYGDVQGEDKNGDEAITEDEAPVKEMSGLAVVSDTEFTVTLEAPNGLFENIVGYSAFAPLPESFFDDPAAFGDNPVGNGPFKFVQWDKKQQIKVTAWDEYKGEDKPYVKDVTFKIYQDLDAAYADLLAGNLDVLDSIPTSALANDQWKSDLGDRYVDQPAGVIQTITFPLYNKPYDNTDLRKAISQAIDREAITSKIFNNTRIPATGYVSPVVEGYKEGVCGDLCSFDPDAAKANLSKSGYSGPVTLSYNADGDHKAWTEAACNSITQTLGIQCTATPFVDFATFRGTINDCKDQALAGGALSANCQQLGMFRTGWQMDYPHIENFLAPIYASTGSANDGTYSNEQVDALFKSAKSQVNPEGIPDYQEAEALIVQDMPAVPLWYGATTAGWSEAITEIQFTPFSRVNLASIQKG